MLIDSHCHLNMLDLSLFDNDMANVIAKAKKNYVNKFLTVCVELDDMPSIIEIIEKFDEVYGSCGLHPTNEVINEPTVQDYLKLANHKKIIAIGEMGLDYYRTSSPEYQKQRFINQIEAAKDLKKPIIIHSRQAKEDTIKLMQKNKADTVGGVMHCFCEDYEMASQAIDLGFYISFSGIVTFKNAKDLQEVAKKVPLDRMLVETDCPYLAPTPYRGKPNEPAYTYYVAEYIANLRGDSFENIAKATTDNFTKLFKV